MWGSLALLKGGAAANRTQVLAESPVPSGIIAFPSDQRQPALGHKDCGSSAQH